MNHILNLLLFEKGNENFPGTNLEISGIKSSSFTDNVIPGECEISFNVRFDHKYNVNELKHIIETSLNEQEKMINIEWDRLCTPYFTESRELKSNDFESFVSTAIHKSTGMFPVISISGGTSDGRFYANSHTQVIEVGLPNATIHQVDERVEIKELNQLEKIYYALLVEIHS